MRKFRIFTIILMLFSISIFYTNCGEGGDTSGLFNTSADPEDDDCFFDQNCDSDNYEFGDESYMEIEILNPDPTYVAVGATAIGVSGGCNDGDFQQNRIDWNIQNDSGTILYDGSIPNACVKNDFSLLIPVLSQYDPNYPAILELELVSIDSSGVEHRSELNTIKQIGLAPETDL